MKALHNDGYVEHVPMHSALIMNVRTYAWFLGEMSWTHPAIAFFLTCNFLSIVKIMQVIR